jgi:hypothetical protein
MFLSYLGLGGLAALLSTVTKADAKASPDGTSRVTRVAAYYNTTSDWMAWAQVMNENATLHQVTVSIYDLSGGLLYTTTVGLNPYQTQTVPIESLPGVAGKQGMVIISSEENKSIAAWLVSRKASQPDYTAVMAPFSPTLMLS